MAAYDSFTKLLMHFDGPNGSTTFTDEIGKTVTPYMSAQISTAQGKFGSSALFSNGYIDVSNTSDLAFGTSDFTFECYIYRNVVGVQQIIYDMRVDNSASPCICLSIYQDKVSLWVNTTETRGITTINALTWYHIAVVRYNGVTKIYVNGVLDCTPWTDSTNYISNSSRPRIGALGGIGDLLHFNGYIDELRVSKGIARWTSNFTPPTSSYTPTVDDDFTKLLMHFDETGNVFSDETGKAITVYGNATQSTTQSKFGGKSAYFDGNGDYLAIPSSTDFNFGSSDFTIDFWAYFNKPSNAAVSFVTIGPPALCIYNYNSNSTFNISYNGVDIVSMSNSTIPNNTWFHVSAIRYNGTLMLFINGVLKASASFTTAISGGVFISTIAGTSYYLNGYIDELRISKGIARWTANFTPPTSLYLPSQVATGGTVTYTDSNDANPSSTPYTGGYKVHTFLSPGTFIVNYSAYMDILVIGAGGPGGNGRGGGGGGAFASKSFSPSAGAYTIGVITPAQNVWAGNLSHYNPPSTFSGTGVSISCENGQSGGDPEGGHGGTASGGDVNISGGNAANYGGSTGGNAGNYGTSTFSGSGGTTNTAGNIYGGGGGTTTPGAPPVIGGGGIVRIRYFYETVLKVTTQTPTSSNLATCIANGTIISVLQDHTVNVRGFCYKLASSVGDPTTSDSVIYDNAGGYTEGTYSKTITGLVSGSAYKVRAYVTDDHSTEYGTTVEVVIYNPYPKVTGGTITYTDSNGLNPQATPYSNGYTVHTFTSNASASITLGGLINYLIVGGGGFGGFSGGGGGGVVTNSVLFSAGEKSIVVGDGGNGANIAGGNSSFDSIIAYGGGCGRVGNAVGGSGASGGGGFSQAVNPEVTYAGGTSTQGYNGGYGRRYSTSYGAAGGGGGGAASDGGASETSPGSGGVGIPCSISGISTTYGSGGGGYVTQNGSSSEQFGLRGVNAGDGNVAAVSNCGGGGAGSNGQNRIGGSGIVIIRYLYSSTSGPTKVKSIFGKSADTLKKVGGIPIENIKSIMGVQ